MSTMPVEEIAAWLDVALGDDADVDMRMRATLIIAAVLEAGGPAAEAAYKAACDTYRRLAAYSAGATTAEIAGRWGPVPGAVLAEPDPEEEEE